MFQRYTAKRALLKGHNRAIEDVKFAAENSKYMVSTSSDGTLMICELFNKQNPTDRQDDVGYVIHAFHIY